MLRLFWRKMFSVIKYFQRNYFLEKMIFLKIFSGVWLLRKNHQWRKTTGDEILLLVDRISPTFTGFRLRLPNSCDGCRNLVCWNPATVTRHRRILAKIFKFRPIPTCFVGFRWWLPDFSDGCQNSARIPAIGYQNLKTFGNRFGLPTNSNAWRWRILTNVRTRMKSLNPKNWKP